MTLFTGHMSGVNWIPAWATGGDDGDERFRVVSGGAVQPRRRVLRNWYADAAITDAQALLADRVASALSGHPAVWAWDLGNENSNCTIPPDPNAAERWLERMTSVLRAHDPRVRITIGTHMEDLEDERLIGPAQAARWCDFVCMHGYPAYADWSTGPTDQHLVPFLAEVTGWLAGGHAGAVRRVRPVDHHPQPASGRPPGRRRRRRQVHRRNARRAPRRRIDRRAALVLRRLRRRTFTDNRRSTSPSTSGPSGCGGPTGRPNRPSTRSADGGTKRAEPPPESVPGSTSPSTSSALIAGTTSHACTGDTSRLCRSRDPAVSDDGHRAGASPRSGLRSAQRAADDVRVRRLAR